MSESFDDPTAGRGQAPAVDLTYRGISLGKRIKLGQVRPSTGFLELAAPMPVGTAIVLATDDGVAIDATVTWVHEQVTGAERPAGMIVSPALAADAATAWWKARVELPDEEAPRRITRTKPVTLRPRSQTLQTPPPDGAVAESAPSLAADLAARVKAAAGVIPAPAPSAPTSPPPSPSPSPPPSPPTMRQTGEHVVIDDGQRTVIMQALDPSMLDLEPRAADALGPPSEAETAVPMTAGDPSDTAAMEVTIETSSDDDDGEADHDAASEAGDAPPASDPAADPANDKGGNGRRKRKRKR